MSSTFNRWFVQYGFRFGLGTLVLVGFLYYAQKQNLQSNFSWILHTANLEHQLMELTYAIQLQDQSDKIFTKINRLKEAAQDNPRQIERLKSVQELFQQKLSLSSDPSFSTSTRQTQSDKLDEQILMLINEMLVEEALLLNERESHSKSSIALIDFPIAIGGLFACLMIYMANRITKRDLLDLLEKDRALQKQAFDLGRSKDALELQTITLNLTLESMADGLIVMDESGRPINFNKAAREMLGYPHGVPAETLDPQKVLRRDPKTKREMTTEELPSAKALRGEFVKDFEVLVEPENLPPRILSFSSSPVFNEAGKIFRAVTVFRDVTQKRAIEDELIKTEKAAKETVQLKSRFLANMSHEIRTPMNGIIGMAELLGGTNLDSKQQSYLNLISESSQSLLTIINDILDFSKIEAGKLDIEKSDFSFSYSIDRTVQLMAHRAHEKNLVLLSYISPQIPEYLRGDDGRIGQVLLNLLGNSIKFTDNGKIIMRANLIERINGQVTIKFEVEDTGIGIDPQAIERLFQPFSQADISTSKRFGGTGLGLSICKQLVELMGGTLGVRSEIGHGSTFWFTLTLEESQANQKREQQRRVFPPDKEVLIFDADPDSARILTDYIESWQLRLRHISQISELQAIIEGASDLTELDLILVSPHPEKSSVESLLTALQKRVDRPRVTMILDDDVPEIQSKYRQFGVANFLTRPLDQSSLYNHLIRMLSEDGSLDHFTVSKVQPQDLFPKKNKSVGRILIAEDNSVNQLIAQAFLKELGYSYHTVANGKEVLEELVQSHFDLVLMDCQMPEMDGFEATREIRKNISTTLPIVALTANAMKGDEAKCREAGMNDYLSKPFHKDQLSAILEKYLSSPESSFDPTRLDLLKGYKDEHGVDLRIALIDTYLEATPASLEKLKNSDDTNLDPFRQLAHTLKSSTAAVGGMMLSEIFEHLETKEFTPQQRKEIMMQALGEFNALKENLLSYQQKLK
jgi:signal transduction histidine kinase/DNA-binding response OmpR family regulator